MASLESALLTRRREEIDHLHDQAAHGAILDAGESLGQPQGLPVGEEAQVEYGCVM
jgi:hypothetical protein